MASDEYTAKAKQELEAAAHCYGLTHGWMPKDQRDSQMRRGQYHATRALVFTNLAILEKQSDA